ncbi:MAG: lycopene beta-cyclase CrtY [Alteraurantiacibacter sp.]
MSGRDCDIAIIGGGLSGGLIALALARHRPDLKVRLVEAGAQLGGNHRWSWFASDLSAAGTALMADFRKAEWNDGYDVRFPAHFRQLDTAYRSLDSADFADRLHRELAGDAILTGCRVTSIDAAGVNLGDNSRIAARCVIDCRGFAPSDQLQGGWQVFMGRYLRTPAPHGVERPVIMDATVDQLAPHGDGGAYRFVYVLPLGTNELFIEDTYYADAPHLDRPLLSDRIDQYQRQMGWSGQQIGFETGVLPVITGGDFDDYQREQRTDGVAMAGARGGFVHPLTSYTLPIAVQVALAVADDANLPGAQMAARLKARARQHWTAMGYYRFLGSMLFGAARPEERYKVFERFYRLSPELIERFYAGRSSTAQKLRVLIGKPPVPVGRAISALLSHSPPLTKPTGKDHQ